MCFFTDKEGEDSREGQLEVIGFDAAYVVRSRRVQSFHQHLQRVTKLQETTIVTIVSFVASYSTLKCIFG